MTTTTIIILFLMSLGAAFVQRTTGFGFGIFIMTALPYVMPSYGEATALSGLLASITSAIIVARTWRHLNLRRLLPILLTFLIVSYFAVGWVATAGEDTLRRILGMALIVASLWFAFLKDRITMPTTLPFQAGMGTLSGIMGGLFGMQGPPAVLYFVTTNKTKESYIAMAQTYFLVGNIMMTLYRYSHGFVTTTVAHAWICGLPAVLLGTWIGSLVFSRLSIGRLRIIIYVYMAISGIIALI